MKKRQIKLLNISCATVFGLAFNSSVIAADTYSESNSALTSNPDWMSALPDGLHLSDMSIPGTHDSTTYTQRGTMYPYMFNWVVTQTMPFGEQFKAGIRILDIRASYSDTTGTADHDGTTGRAFTIFHGAYYLDKNFYDVLRDVNGFLDNHPREVIFMRLKQEHTAVSAGVFKDAVDAYMKTGSNARHVWKDAAKNPTLGNLRGKLVILNDMPGGCDSGQRSAYAPMPYGCDSGTNFVIQDKYDASLLATKWTAINDQFDSTNTGNWTAIYVNFLSASSGLSPSSFAASEDPWSYGYIAAHRNQRLGMVMTDFPGPDLINGIIGVNGPFIAANFYTGAPNGRIRNAWHPDQYLNTENGLIQSSLIREGWDSAKWNIIPVPGTNGEVYIQNAWHPDQCLNIESGFIQSTPINLGWLSARWKLVPVPGAAGEVNIQNIWRSDQYLNVELD